ncbi:MAG: M42 family metallopeptidase [Kiritimatiellia bacterium]|nr:M42 family metallopeptidase [Kiritimatiellia bacterium]
MKKTSLAILERLIGSISPSGYEGEAIQVWREEAATFASDIRSDSHGNCDVVIHPGGGPRVMLSGHVDEIGFLITHIDDKGFLWIEPVGGWDDQIPQGHQVTIRGKQGRVPGVIGKGPIHLMKKENRDKVTRIEEMWVDIGADSRKSAEKLVSIGDPLVLSYGMTTLHGNFVAGRGFDNRAGAFVVLEAARRLAAAHPKAEIHAVASVQEEIGLRGARTAAFGIDPQVGFAVDVTFATDHPSMGDATRRRGKIELGKGAVITRGPNIHPKIFDLLVETARKQEIKHQIAAEARPTGTDANAIQISRSGVAAGLVSIPNRYMHSPCELVHLDDLDACAELIAATVLRIGPKLDLMPF